MTLHPCRHRSADTVHHNGRDRYTCTHPLVCRPNPSELVVAQQCQECPYVGFDATRARTLYMQLAHEAPTAEEHSTRVTACDTCEVRQDNHCPPAGGSCSLLQKLTKAAFACPIGKFGEIKR